MGEVAKRGTFACNLKGQKDPSAVVGSLVRGPGFAVLLLHAWNVISFVHWEHSNNCIGTAPQLRRKAEGTFETQKWDQDTPQT